VAQIINKDGWVKNGSCPGLNHKKVSKRTVYYIGLDIHKKVIAYCIKARDGRQIEAGMIAAARKALDEWVKRLPGPWIGAMEATLFIGWIHDYLAPMPLN